MTDSKTLAYINLNGVLGCLEQLCELDEEARNLAKTEKPMSIGINVTDGPIGKLEFNNGKVNYKSGETGGKIGLKLFSCEHFNGMIDGKRNPFPYKGLFSLKFLTHNFIKLTEILTKYLRASKKDLEDRVFFEKSTTLMFYLIVCAVSQIGNFDKLGKISAKRIPDGDFSIEILDGPSALIEIRSGKMRTLKKRATNARAFMIFKDFDTARALFEGTKDAMTCIADGTIIMKGYVPIIDNFNKVLGRVATYLA